MKKEWTKPKLVSLYRGRPEESVLSSCKTSATGVPGPDGLGYDCDGGGNDCLELVAT